MSGQPPVYLLALDLAERGLFDIGGEAIPNLLHKGETIRNAEPIEAEVFHAHGHRTSSRDEVRRTQNTTVSTL